MKNTIKKLGISAAAAAMLLTTSANTGSVAGFGGSLEITQDAAWIRQFEKWASRLTPPLL